MACFLACSSVYDNESSLYYLQSRYYDPALGRFINADVLVSTGQGILGNNTFAYCSNNPITRIDASGEFFNTICGALVGGVLSVLTRDKDAETGGQAFLRGAVTGAIAGAGLDICVATAGVGGMVIAGFLGVVSGVMDTAWEKTNQGKKASPSEIVVNGIIGCGLNLLFGAAGREAGRAVGNTLKTVGKAIYTNFRRSITNRAGKVVAQKVAEAALSNSVSSTIQGAAAKGYSLIINNMVEEMY